jgi:LysR family glycine cleavage system transcriptional activator
MQNDNRKLAIFGALPVLEAAVRHNSFTKAAREFGLTQSALSRRIQGLERDLGVVLFARRGRSITLTEDGARLADVARASLELLENAQHQSDASLSGTLTVGVLPSLASCWLIPRLSAFCANHPDLQVRIETIEADFRDDHKDPVTWDPSSLDVVVTRGRGGWRSLVATRLFDEAMIAVRSPEFDAQVRLGHSTRTGAWQAYIDKTGIEINLSRPALVFEHYFMVREAVRAGNGIGLLPSVIVEGDLKTGELIACGPPASSGAGYYALSTDRNAKRPTTAAFVNWLPTVQHNG